jgi:hypothetical protein
MRYFFVVAAFTTFSACATPGEGPQAQQGYNTCEPIISALEAYKNSRGEYPQTLKDLKPKYLKSIPEKLGEEPIEYSRRSKNEFILDFTYIENGAVNCDYTPSRKWKCYAYH